jgi:hypothetical protein
MKKIALSLVMLGLLVLVGCASKPTAVVYDATSWEDMVPATCKNFFDGCNQCMRMPDSDVAACTKMFCEIYAEPYCLDEDVVETEPVVESSSDIRALYIGLSVEDAMAQAEANDTLFRVVQEDGEPLAVTMDYRPGRLNATVEDGIVVSVEVE